MGERTQYTAGTFSWAELSTPDQAGAGKFYAELFGWELEENPIGDDQVYVMAKLNGRYVAAIAPQPSQQREAGVPPSWNSYITVESADEALEEARQFGANLHAPAFDVFDAGRMGVVQDPQGAFFMVWEPKAHIGAGLVNAPGALSWNELATPDPEASASFYSRVFGWSTERMEGMDPPYLTIKAQDGHTNGGIRQAASTEPCYWLAYFGAGDIDRAMGQVTELGGSCIMGPVDIGVGRIGVVQDPQEAVFALYAGQFED